MTWPFCPRCGREISPGLPCELERCPWQRDETGARLITLVPGSDPGPLKRPPPVRPRRRRFHH